MSDVAASETADWVVKSAAIRSSASRSSSKSSEKSRSGSPEAGSSAISGSTVPSASALTGPPQPPEGPADRRCPRRIFDCGSHLGASAVEDSQAGVAVSTAARRSFFHAANGDAGSAAASGFRSSAPRGCSGSSSTTSGSGSAGDTATASLSRSEKIEIRHGACKNSLIVSADALIFNLDSGTGPAKTGSSPKSRSISGTGPAKRAQPLH